MMKFRAKIVLFIFGISYLILGVLLLLYSIKIIEPEDLRFLWAKIPSSLSLDVVIGLIGGFLILSVITLLNFVWSGIESERNIAFRTDYGEVLVSLSAIEEYIRRFLREDPEIKELRVKVSARKKNLLVLLRAVILSESNIPGVTENIQSQLRARLQEMLGMEEPITVRLYVSKIGEEEKRKKGKEVQESKEEPLPPYRKF
jgi:uncharacterized alkaline shock family protein YloU